MLPFPWLHRARLRHQAIRWQCGHSDQEVLALQSRCVITHAIRGVLYISWIMQEPVTFAEDLWCWAYINISCWMKTRQWRSQSTDENDGVGGWSCVTFVGLTVEVCVCVCEREAGRGQRPCVNMCAAWHERVSHGSDIVVENRQRRLISSGRTVQTFRSAKWLLWHACISCLSPVSFPCLAVRILLPHWTQPAFDLVSDSGGGWLTFIPKLGCGSTQYLTWRINKGWLCWMESVQAWFERAVDPFIHSTWCAPHYELCLRLYIWNDSKYMK